MLETLKNTRISIYNEIKNKSAEYLKTIDAVLKNYFENDGWFARSLDKERLEIGFYTDQLYKNGERRLCTLTINHGYEDSYGHVSADFKFEINPFTGGTFSVIENNYLKTYFSMVGELCNSSSFVKNLISILKDYHTSIKCLYDNYNDVCSEINKIERNIILEQEKESREKYYNKVKNAAQDQNNYVVIDMGKCINNYDERITYRKRNVKVLFIGEELDCYTEIKKYYKSEYHSYKVISISKLKIA